MNARGFTLVEMLVAMVVFSLLAAAAAGLLSVSVRNTDTFERADATIRELQLARTIMRSDFAQIALRPVRDAYGARTPAVFSGGDAADGKAILAFVRRGWDNPGGADGRASLQYVEYALDGGALVRRSRPYLDPTPETPTTATTLISGVTLADVSFLSRGVWSERWVQTPAQAVLPEAIAVQVALPSTGAIRQAFLVGEPR